MKYSIRRSIKTFSRGIAPIILIIAAAIIGLIVILFVTGALKFRGKIEFRKNQETPLPKTDTQVKTNQSSSIPSPKVSKPLNLSQTYISNTRGFSINYPQNWQVDDNGDTVNIFTEEENATSAESSKAGVIISVAPLGKLQDAQLSTIVDLWRGQISNQFPQATITSEESTQIGNKEAYLYMFTFTNQGLEFPSRLYLLADEQNIYVIIATTDSANLAKYEDALKSISESFRLI